MITTTRVLVFSMMAALPVSCSATDSVLTSACDAAAALVVEQYEDHHLESDEDLLQKTGHRRLYYQAVLEPGLTEEQLKSLRADSQTSKSVMASLSLAGESGKLSQLVKSGFSADSVSEEGVPILTIAAQCERVETVNLLLDVGANIYSHDRQNIDAMAVAILENADAVVRTLVAHGYKIDARSESGRVTDKLARSLHNGKYSKLLADPVVTEATKGDGG